MTNFAYYDDYEIRITMLCEHSTALKYTAAGQRLEPTLLEQYNGPLWGDKNNGEAGLILDLAPEVWHGHT